MTADTLLAQLIPRVTAPEPAATLALECILSALPEGAQGLVDAVAGRAGVKSFAVGRIVAESSEGDARPDLTVHDADGQVRLLIENKFWAGLTEAQPVRYLELLSDDLPSMLLFVVPSPRVPSVWRELKHRCRQHGNGIEWTDESADDSFPRAQAGGRVLAVTSWRYVLETLEEIARRGDHKAAEADVAQLRGLTDRMSSQNVFLPLQEGEAEDTRVAQRMTNYIDLIGLVVDRLVSHHDFKVTGRPIHSWYYSACRVVAHERFTAVLGISLGSWLACGSSPLWWWSETDWEKCGFQGQLARAKVLFDDAVAWGSHLNIPVPLTAGVERDRVIRDAAAHVAEIADRLNAEFPCPATSTGAS